MIAHVVRVKNFGDQLKIANRLANRDCEVMGVYDAPEIKASFQTLMGDYQQVFILTEEHSPKRRGSVQEQVIVERCPAIFLGGQNIHAAPAQSRGDGGW